MTTLGRQFGGHGGIPRPKGGDRGGSRPPDVLTDHPEMGKVGTLSAIARELGMNPPALHMHRRRRADFPTPIIGGIFALADIMEFREATGSHEYDS